MSAVAIGIPSPYPFLLQSVSDEDDVEDDGDEEGDEGGSAFARLDPEDPQDFGGDGVDPEEDDDSDTGFGLGAFLGIFAGLGAAPA